jgi:hypothetical protein
MQSAREFEAILRKLAAEQQGLVTRAGLLHAGVAAHVVERRVRSGRLKPLHRGVYQAGPVAGPRAREMAAVLACGRECRVSHTTAGEMWDLLAVRPSAPHVDVTMHRSRRVRIDGIRVHRVNELDPDEATELEGIPVTRQLARCSTSASAWACESWSTRWRERSGVDSSGGMTCVQWRPVISSNAARVRCGCCCGPCTTTSRLP